MQTIKILHSFPEKETKFKDYCRLTFEIDRFENTYVSNLDEVTNYSEFDVVILHYLRKEDYIYLANNKIDKPIIWFCWGADIFNQGRFYNKFLLHETKLLRRRSSFKHSLLGGLKQIIKEIVPVTIDYSKTSRAKFLALNQIDYIVPVMPRDYNLIIENYEVNFLLHHLNYVNPLIGQNSYNGISGQNVLLGNSASFTNNHVEAIDQLSKIDLKGRKLIIPLSYGNSDLSNYIAEYANRVLGKDRVIILKDFIPFSEYNEILSSCEIVIMNHLRQQAAGNIVQSLLNGAHIYLRKESTIYQFLHENGFKISCFNDVSELEGLSQENILFNRSKAEKIFGAEAQHKKLMDLMNKALN
jgi:hypothetical protein